MTAPTDSATGLPDEGSEGATLGAMLRQAREQRNLSVADLAACLRLEPRIVQRLERNQFDLLPAPAFIRGYVRSIAKQLEIDSAPLIAVFNLRFDDEPPTLSDFESRAPTQITSDSSVIRYTTIGLGIVMVLMIGLWWQAHDITLPSFSRSGGTADTFLPIEPATEPLSYSFRQVTHPENPFYRADPLLLPALATSGDAPIDDGRDSMTPADSAADTPAGSADIVISTREEAWIAISDSLGRRLHYSIARPGNEILIDGEPPYSLVIGNAPAVTVRFEGQPFDILRFAREGIARFELGDGPRDTPGSNPQ